MKKLFIALLWIFFSRQMPAQVVFCPAGAEWHYSFGISSSEAANETIKYVRDTVIGAGTFKVLRHTRSYPNCNLVYPVLTVIRQEGDTVFFRNSRTQNNWQILYNFDIQPGFGWQTSLFNSNNSLSTFIFVIDSINYVTINGKNLKRLYMGTESITERIGWNSFMFRYYNEDCNGDLLGGMLCYQDFAFGTKKFTEQSCDFTGVLSTTGFKSAENDLSLRISPNPVSDNLKIEMKVQYPSMSATFRLVNLVGEEVLPATTVQTERPEFLLNIAQLHSGVYFLQVYKEGSLLATEKLIKD